MEDPWDPTEVAKAVHLRWLGMVLPSSWVILGGDGAAEGWQCQDCTQHSWERAEDKIQLAYGCFQCDSQLHLARSSPTPEHLHKAAPQHTQLGSISEHRTFQVNMLQKRPISSMSSTRTSLNNTPCLRFKHVTAVFLQLQWLYRALLPVKSGADSVGLREMYADFTKPKLSSAFIPQHLRRESSSNFL